MLYICRCCILPIGYDFHRQAQDVATSTKISHEILIKCIYYLIMNFILIYGCCFYIFYIPG